MPPLWTREWDFHNFDFIVDQTIFIVGILCRQGAMWSTAKAERFAQVGREFCVDLRASCLRPFARLNHSNPLHRRQDHALRAAYLLDVISAGEWPDGAGACEQCAQPTGNWCDECEDPLRVVCCVCTADGFDCQECMVSDVEEFDD